MKKMIKNVKSKLGMFMVVGGLFLFAGLNQPASALVLDDGGGTYGTKCCPDGTTACRGAGNYCENKNNC